MLAPRLPAIAYIAHTLDFNEIAWEMPRTFFRSINSCNDALLAPRLDRSERVDEALGLRSLGAVAGRDKSPTSRVKLLERLGERRRGEGAS